MYLQYRISSKGPVILLCYDRVNWPGCGGDDQQDVDNAWLASERLIRAFQTADPDDFERWPMDWSDAKELGKSGDWGRLIATKRYGKPVEIHQPHEMTATYA